MFDIHSHILYDVDDGVKDISESITILKNMSENGFTDIILTPHYIEYSKYDSSRENNLKKFNLIKEEIKKEKIKIKIYLGNEIYITENILDLIKDNKISPLNNGKYLLIELPMNTEFNNYLDIFNDLRYNGYNVILAHPERYIYFKNNFNKYSELKEYGILFQINLESILGKYGSYSKKTVKKLLKNNYVDFIGSDIHYNKHDYSYIEKAKKKISKYISEDDLENIFVKNPKQII